MPDVMDENEIYCCQTCLTEHPKLTRIGTLCGGADPEVCEFCGQEFWKLAVAVELEYVDAALAGKE